MLILGGGKSKDDTSETDSPEEEAAEDQYIDEFISAMKDGDSEGARAAFKSAVRACASKEEAGEYDEGA
jgi:hypothetical protein